MNSKNECKDIEFVRRCHICHVTTIQKEKRIECCSHCGKIFIPYFFCMENSLERHLTSDTFAYPPIYGISLSWT